MTNHKDALTKALETLEGIASAKPHEWEDPEQFKPWAQNRARHAAQIVTTALSAIPADATQSADKADDLASLAGFLADAVLGYPDFDCANENEPRPLCDLANRVKSALTAPQDAQERIAHLEAVIDRVLLDIDDDGVAEARDVAVLAMRNVRLGRRMYHGLDAATQPSDKLEDQFCDANCTWADHHPDCVRADKPEGKAEQAVRDEVLQTAFDAVDNICANNDSEAAALAKACDAIRPLQSEQKGSE